MGVLDPDGPDDSRAVVGDGETPTSIFYEFGADDEREGYVLSFSHALFTQRDCRPVGPAHWRYPLLIGTDSIKSCLVHRFH